MKKFSQIVLSLSCAGVLLAAAAPAAAVGYVYRNYVPGIKGPGLSAPAGGGGGVQNAESYSYAFSNASPVDLSPASGVNVGASSAELYVTLLNSGDAISLVGDPVSSEAAEFPITSTPVADMTKCVNGLTLAKNTTCVVTTKFTPAQGGARTSTLSLATTAGAPASIDLTGFGYSSCTLPWGGVLTHGAETPAYTQSSVDADSCDSVAVTETCNMGTLSYPTAVQSCTPHDPYLNSVVAAFHFDGPNGGTTFTNSHGSISASAVAGTGAYARLTTATSKSGGASLDLSSGRVELNAAAIPSTGSFTAEAWVKVTNPSNRPVIFAQYINTGSNTDFTGRFLLDITGGNLHFGTGSSYELTSTSAVPVNTWTHVALVRDTSAGTMSLYMGGSRVATALMSTGTALSQRPTWIGMSPHPSYPYPFAGQMDDLRFTNGARYSGSTYTVPATPFANQ